nr:unnamed protein product [Spirometra erinaceieuropaei]
MCLAVTGMACALTWRRVFPLVNRQHFLCPDICPSTVLTYGSEDLPMGMFMLSITCTRFCESLIVLFSSCVVLVEADSLYTAFSALGAGLEQPCFDFNISVHRSKNKERFCDVCLLEEALERPRRPAFFKRPCQRHCFFVWSASATLLEGV